jgi:hypothetical protein
MKFGTKAFIAFLLIATASAISGKMTEEKKTYKIGDRGPAGGWIIYDRGPATDKKDIKRWRYLEAAPADQGTEAVWSDPKTKVTGASGIELGTGYTNTAKIIKAHGGSAEAAKLCANYRGGGMADWYLPSKKELALMFTNLKTQNIGDFADKEYWSSSESDEAYAWYQGFADGAVDSNTKTNRLRVRAVRAFGEE